jgi:ABC-type dipeptide/oligopeptide/nickel transport system permease component
MNDTEAVAILAGLIGYIVGYPLGIWLGLKVNQWLSDRKSK